MKKIGQWLKDCRRASGKSQLDTSYDTYISLDTIRAIENGKIYPRTNHFEKLCAVFGVTPSEYYKADAPNEDSQPSNALPSFPPTGKAAPNTND